MPSLADIHEVGGDADSALARVRQEGRPLPRHVANPPPTAVAQRCADVVPATVIAPEAVSFTRPTGRLVRPVAGSALNSHMVRGQRFEPCEAVIASIECNNTTSPRGNGTERGPKKTIETATKREAARDLRGGVWRVSHRGVDETGPFIARGDGGGGKGGGCVRAVPGMARG